MCGSPVAHAIVGIVANDWPLMIMLAQTAVKISRKDQGMAALTPERARIRGRWWRLTVAGVGIALAALFLLAAPIYGDGHLTTITGRVVNGTSGEMSPAELEVVLHGISASGVANVTSVGTDEDGLFQFPDVEVDGELAYAVTANYGGVLYSTRLNLPQSEEVVELMVYETTNSIEHLRIDADVLLIKGPGTDGRELSAFEAIGLSNRGDRTFVPDLGQPAAMNFLRFSLPENAANVEVSSDLPGGRTINVGTGFALTAPVIPGSHQVTATYWLPYEGNRLDLARSFPMGAETFRLLLAEAVGEVGDPGPLTSMSAVNVDGETYAAWGGVQMARGEKLKLRLINLRQPPLLNRLGDALGDGPYLKIGLPAAVGFVLACLVLYSLAFRRPEQITLGGRPGTPAVREARSTGGPEGRSLVAVIAQLDDQFQSGELPQEDYQRRRQDLKSRLLRLALNSNVE